MTVYILHSYHIDHIEHMHILHITILFLACGTIKYCGRLPGKAKQ